MREVVKWGKSVILMRVEGEERWGVCGVPLNGVIIRPIRLTIKSIYTDKLRSTSAMRLTMNSDT